MTIESLILICTFPTLCAFNKIEDPTVLYRYLLAGDQMQERHLQCYTLPKLREFDCDWLFPKQDLVK